MFGLPLVWARSDEYKASSISYILQGVSITNETDWIRMAKFHAEYSRKMCDASRDRKTSNTTWLLPRALSRSSRLREKPGYRRRENRG